MNFFFKWKILKNIYLNIEKQAKIHSATKTTTSNYDDGRGFAGEWNARSADQVSHSRQNPGTLPPGQQTNRTPTPKSVTAPKTSTIYQNPIFQSLKSTWLTWDWFWVQYRFWGPVWPSRQRVAPERLLVPSKLVLSCWSRASPKLLHTTRARILHRLRRLAVARAPGSRRLSCPWASSLVDRSAHHEDIREDAQGEPLRSAGRGGRAGNPWPCSPVLVLLVMFPSVALVGRWVFVGVQKDRWVGCWGLVGAVAVIVGKDHHARVCWFGLIHLLGFLFPESFRT